MQRKAAGIKLLLLDVDGVMTNGQIIYDGAGNELKMFHVRDGHGLKLLQRAGIKVGIITGRSSQVVSRRAAELDIEILYQGALNKLDPYLEIVTQSGLREEQIAYMGDDLIDLPVLRRVGFSATVADADADVRGLVDYVSKFSGGAGAVREICDLLLKAGGHWDEVTARYFSADR
ncbi:KdsC family phosphatase [Geopsychrobacter electrodiphilus]|uniref:KdsC family phosphatase n=1 Tax=Geopsychrobacter electrodiphilus TaxID=225196 RepID=UPI00035CDE0E|nr:HAD-IIIA family hydrolase [Geopsychrobacter electrodiphilus]